MMTLLDVFIEFINSSLHLYIAFIFFSSFWNRKFSRLTTVAVYFILVAFLTSSQLFLKGNPLIYIPMVLLTASLSILFDGKFFHKPIFSIIIISIMSIIEMIVGLSISFLFNVSLEICKTGALYVTGMLASRFILFLIVILIRIKKRKPLITQIKKSYFNLFLFPLSSLAIILLQHMMLLTPNINQNNITFLILIAYTLLISANMIVFDFIDSLYENSIFEGKISAANQIINGQTAQYQTLIDHNNEILRMHHDNKNFCIGLITELKAGNIDVAINKLTIAYDFNQEALKADFNIVSILVSLKKQETICVDNKIEIFSYYQNINKVLISPTDMAVVVGNLLDNAIEACAKIPDQINVKKEIEVFVSVQNNNIFIKIQNPTLNSIDVTNLVSTKKEKHLHGIGILSVQQIARKYNGEVIFSYEDNIFTTTVILDNISLN